MLKKDYRKPTYSIKKFFTYIFLLIYALFTIYPIIWLFLNSMKDDFDFANNSFGLPKKISFINFIDVFPKMSKYLLNSVIVSLSTVVVTLIVSSMAAYAIKRLNFKYGKYFLAYFLIGIFIPIQTVLIPLVFMFSKIGLNNSYLTLIVPYVAFALPMAIFIFAGFFQSIPKSIEEAAFIDGCSVYRCFISIIVPITAPAFVTVAILTFLSSWNEMMTALLLISNEKLYTVTIGLLNYVGQYSSQQTKLLAATTLSIIPALILYLLLHDKITKGMMSGSIKG